MRTYAPFAAALLACVALHAQTPTGDDIVKGLQQERPYHVVSAEQFGQLGWPLPDGGATVKALADAAPGGAFDPRDLERIDPAKLGYRAKWQVVRYKLYGLDWDVTGLQLTPLHPVAGVPTIAVINGGAANWYEFFIDPLNRPGFGQYLAEFTTAVKYGMPILHVLLDNAELGKISREQISAIRPVWQTELVNPDFAAYADSCGGRGFRVSSANELPEVLAKAVAVRDRPALVVVPTAATAV